MATTKKAAPAVDAANTDQTAAPAVDAATAAAPAVGADPLPELVNNDNENRLEAIAANPVGTTYNEVGVASFSGEGFNPSEHPLTDLPAGHMYNEDGSVFTIPADAAKIEQQLVTDIAGAKLACSKVQQKITSSEEMLADADAEDKPVFEKAINSQKIALESHKAVLAEKEEALKAHKLSLITPGARAIEKELLEKTAARDILNLRITELQNQKRILGGDTKPAASSTPKAPSPSAPSTDEQKANHAAAVAQYGSQGKAIVAYVKEGWTNTEIYKHLGIPPASVPGPKNDFLKSEAGKVYIVNAEGRAVLR